MKTILSCAILTMAIAITATSADAKGCIKGAIVGGVAGHAVHHGLMGAAAGCVIGHHEAKKHEEYMQQGPQTAPSPQK
jgi:outer membrane lipoprotein SlyB